MDVVATVLGIVILLWIPIGPIVGYALAVRGYRFQSPIARHEEED
jgi:hypothetical protein